MLPSGFRTRKPSPAWLSTSGSPSPAWIVWHTNGRWWGPEKIGPVRGWLTSVRRSFAGADERRLCTTASVFWPSSSPATNPTRPPSSRSKASVTSSPLRSTRSLSSRPRGASTRTRASPPLTISASLESTSRCTDLACAAGAAATAATSPTMPSTQRLGIAPTSSSPWFGNVSRRRPVGAGRKRAGLRRARPGPRPAAGARRATERATGRGRGRRARRRRRRTRR